MEVHTCSEYLQGVMSVSARRVALTPSSLTLPRDFYYRRYQVLRSSQDFSGVFLACIPCTLPQFLLRCGHYRHPDPGAKARVWHLYTNRPDWDQTGRRPTCFVFVFLTDN